MKLTLAKVLARKYQHNVCFSLPVPWGKDGFFDARRPSVVVHPLSVRQQFALNNISSKTTGCNFTKLHRNDILLGYNIKKVGM